MAFGGGLDDQAEVMSEINMTPLVDVMLVLLIIFIITVPVLTHSVNVDLPQAENAPAEIKPETINIALDAQGKIFWNETPVTTAELDAHLASAAAQQPQPEIHLRGDKALAYGQVAQTMAAIQRAGISKLGFITQPGE